MLKAIAPKLCPVESEFCLITSAGTPPSRTTVAWLNPSATAWKWAALPFDGAGRSYSTITRREGKVTATFVVPADGLPECTIQTTPASDGLTSAEFGRTSRPSRALEA
jgi:hypothetical protein